MQSLLRRRSRGQAVAWGGLAAIVWMASVGCSRGPAASSVAPEIARLVDAAAVGDEPLVESRAVSRFYKGRGSRPAWTAHADELVDAIQATSADGLEPAHYHLDAIRARLARRDAAGPRDAAELDVLLADAVAAIADDVRYGHVRPAEVNPAWTADPRAGAPPLDSTLAVIASAGSPREALAAQRPDHFIYRGLVGALASLRGVVTRGGWPAVPGGRTLHAGVVDRRVAVLRRRLALGGDADAAATPDSNRFDAALAAAVARFQARHRLDSTGVVDGATLAAINVPADARLAQVRVNLERARWVLGGLTGDFLLVNLPAFKAYLIAGGQNAWESRTQIGEEAMQTPTFRAKLRTIVFNPDWTVPPTVLANEILQDMRSNPNALEDRGLVVYDRANRVVDPATIDWNAVTPDSFPYTIRQPAGDANALGKVKFLFPNPYAIYLHDTPSRQLFDARRRTFSHGCIRLEHPLELAALLLQGQDDWDAAKIDSVVAADSTRAVALQRTPPILIVYWTVSVGASGEVRYADDIYHLDPPLLAALDRPARRP